VKAPPVTPPTFTVLIPVEFTKPSVATAVAPIFTVSISLISKGVTDREIVAFRTSPVAVVP
jgi:hypothetical protein